VSLIVNNNIIDRNLILLRRSQNYEIFKIRNSFRKHYYVKIIFLTMKKDFVALVAFLLIVSAFIAGCASISIYSTVNPDTTISNYKMTIDTTSMVYGLIDAQIKSNFDQSLYNYDEKWNGDKVTITFTAKSNIRSNDPVNWTIQKVNNQMVYEDKRFMSFPASDASNPFSNSMANTVSLNYYLEMPGKITSSTANKIDGNKAEWHLQGNKIATTDIYASSDLPLLPGFDALVGIIGIIAALFLVKVKKY